MLCIWSAIYFIWVLLTIIFQDVRVIKFESPEELLCYSCGDVAVVRPSNSGDAIESLLEALPQMNSDDIITVSQKDPDMPVPQHLTRPSTFLELATHYWDLNVKQSI